MGTVNWRFSKAISVEVIKAAESYFGIKFPSDYAHCAGNHNGGYPKPHSFPHAGSVEALNNLITLDASGEYNIYEVYEHIRDRMAEKVVPFARDPFGNYLCFDYRRSEQPVIVFWDHEVAYRDKDKAITFVCNTFTELLDSLFTYED